MIKKILEIYNNIFNKNIKITEDIFCNYIRIQKQDKLIKKMKKSKTDINTLIINWNYISQYDKLTINFIKYFKNNINFKLLSINKNINYDIINEFKHNLNWILLSKTYNFTIDEMKYFNKFIKWEYIFFYNNNPSEDLKFFFKENLWWLFLKDNLIENIDNHYYYINQKILNKNIQLIDESLIDTFNYKLNEYIQNKKTLKKILKIQLLNLYNEYDNNNKLLELKDINCETLFDF